MKWRPTIYLGRWAGVEIRLDILLLVLIALLFFSSVNSAQATNTPGEIWTAVAHLALLVALVFCMFLHEVGHALMCKLRGHEPRMILLSFVGLTFFKTKKVKPGDEFWIALSGPMVNMLIALTTFPFVIIHLTERGAPPLLSQAAMASLTGFMSWLSILNFLVGLGNLTPGWPADGARAVRGWLARKYGYGAGTVRAVAISHGFWLVLAGVSVLIMTGAPIADWVQGQRNVPPTYSSWSMIVMYNVVFLVMAVIGIYYGWAEKRRVALLGAEKAAAVPGPPPEFMPRPRNAEEKAEDETPAKEDDEPDRVDELKDKAKDTINAGKALYKVAKATGKGTGWMAKQGIKAVGAMLERDDKQKEKETKKGDES
jgi:Zn-dependent protease